MSRSVLALFAVAVVLAGLAAWLRPGPPEAPAGARVADLLGAADPAPGLRRALQPGAIRLPADHGPHPDYRSGWWYFTGSLADAAGREYGFQLTFFRFALAATEPPADSPWRDRQLYMAHLAVTDVAAGRHRAVERLARPGPGLAGARAAPFEVWLDDWSAASRGTGFLPLRLSAAAADAGLAIDLELGPGKPVVEHGDRGLSAKGPEPGNASYYYSFTRLPASGRLTLDGRTIEVRGQAWMDREWGTSSLGAGIVGWDWFSLQLDDGRDLMLYALRDAAGRATAVSAGSIVGPGGERVALGRDDFALYPLAAWRSPRTGVNWPVRWRLDVPAAGLALTVRALVDDQEQPLAVLYWEGAVEALDAKGARAGRGYLEMTGYAQPNSAR